MRIIPFHQDLRGQGTITEILFYGLIEVLSFKDGYCYASNQYLGEAMGITKNAAANLLSALTKKGWVQVELDEYNHRIGIRPLLTATFGDDEGGVHSTREYPPHKLREEGVNEIREQIYKDKYKSNIKDIPNGISLAENPPKSEGCEEKSFGNEQINKAFQLWEEVFGYSQKNSAANRRAAYNMLRAKDKGERWLLQTMQLLFEAQKDRYAGNIVNGISGFADLQANWPKVWKWGSTKATQNNDAAVVTDLNKM